MRKTRKLLTIAMAFAAVVAGIPATAVSAETAVSIAPAATTASMSGSTVVAPEENSGKCGDNAFWMMDGANMTITGTGSIDYFKMSKDRVGKVDIQEGPTGIGIDAFGWFNNLSQITVPDSVTFIDACAFEGCRSLTGIRLSNRITAIEYGTFHGCTSLPEVTLPKSVVSIGETAFGNCTSLTKIKIPNNVTSIEYKTFYNCTSLPKVIVPSKVTAVKEKAFEDCTSLEMVSFMGDAPVINGDAFTNVTARAYYPIDNVTWTPDKMQNYGGNLTWEGKISLRIIPEITDTVYVLGSSKDVTIKCSGELADFVDVEIDGVVLDKSYYMTRDGSTVLTILSSYLDTLAVGEHVVTLNYTYGYVDTILNVVGSDEASKTANTKNMVNTTPETGDDSVAMLWIVIGLSSASIGFAALKKKRETV